MQELVFSDYEMSVSTLLNNNKTDPSLFICSTIRKDTVDEILKDFASLYLRIDVNFLQECRG
jgi:hypothetical protein